MNPLLIGGIIRLHPIGFELPTAPATLTTYVWLRDKGFCIYCGKPGRHVDHILPRSHGGRNIKENVVLACCGCNIRKGRSFDVAFLAMAFKHLLDVGESLDWVDDVFIPYDYDESDFSRYTICKACGGAAQGYELCLACETADVQKKTSYHLTNPQRSTIYKLLRDRGWKLKQIADHFGVSHQAISLSLKKHAKSESLQREIAELEKRIADLKRPTE